MHCGCCGRGVLREKLIEPSGINTLLALQRTESKDADYALMCAYLRFPPANGMECEIWLGDHSVTFIAQNVHFEIQLYSPDHRNGYDAYVTLVPKDEKDETALKEVNVEDMKRAGWQPENWE